MLFYGVEGTIELKSCLFENFIMINETSESTRNGGVLVCQNMNITIDNCSFNNCFAYYQGGACYFVFTSAGYIVTITNSVFSDCESLSGGVISVYVVFTSVSISVDDCTFRNCSSSDMGGDLFIYLCISFIGVIYVITTFASCSSSFNNCLFVNCESGSKGGAIYYNGNSSLSIQCCVFDKCMAGFFLLIFLNCYLLIS
jgi:hypothetical protein